MCLWAAVGLTRIRAISFHCCLKKFTAQQQAHVLELLNREDLEIDWKRGFEVQAVISVYHSRLLQESVMFGFGASDLLDAWY